MTLHGLKAQVLTAQASLTVHIPKIGDKPARSEPIELGTFSATAGDLAEWQERAGDLSGVSARDALVTTMMENVRGHIATAIDAKLGLTPLDARFAPFAGTWEIDAATAKIDSSCKATFFLPESSPIVVDARHGTLAIGSDRGRGRLVIENGKLDTLIETADTSCPGTSYTRRVQFTGDGAERSAVVTWSWLPDDCKTRCTATVTATIEKQTFGGK